MITLIAQTFTAVTEAAPTPLERIDTLVFFLLAILAGYQKWRASKAGGLLDAVIIGVETYKATLPKAEAKRVTGIISAVALEEGAEPALHAEVKRVTESARKAYVPPPDDPGDPFPRRAAALLLCASLLLGASGCLSASVRDLADTQRVGIEQLADTSQPSEEWLAEAIGKPDREGKPWTREALIAAWRAKWPALLEATAAIRRAAE